MDWRSVAKFPTTVSTDWQAQKNGGRKYIFGKAAVDAAVARWSPFSSLLVAAPGNSRFLPVMNIDQLSARAQQSLVKRVQLSIVVVFLAAAVTTAIWLLQDKEKALRSTLVLLGIGFFAVIDYWTVIRHATALTERALFSFHVRATGRFDALMWGGLMLAAGALQLLGESLVGGDDPFILEYGIYYPALATGEFWRLLTGPFIHANLAHWASNSTMLILAGVVTGTISRRHAVSVFIAGSASGALVALMCVPYTHAEAYLGVSAGIIAMGGFCGGVAWRHPNQFPIKFAFTILTLSALNIYLAWIWSTDASNAGHITGIFVGIIIGLAFKENSARPMPLR